MIYTINYDLSKYGGSRVVSSDKLGNRDIINGYQINYDGLEDRLEDKFQSPKYWDDIRISGTSMRGNSSAPEMTEFASGIYLPAYAAASTVDQSFFACQMPHSYIEGTDIHPHIHWAANVSGVAYNNQGIAWMLDYTWGNPHDVLSPVGTMSGIATWTTGNNGLIQYKHYMTDFIDANGNDTINGISKKVSNMFIGRLYRLNTHSADTFTEPAFVLEFDLHFQTDGFGSRQEGVK